MLHKMKGRSLPLLFALTLSVLINISLEQNSSKWWLIVGGAGVAEYCSKLHSAAVKQSNLSFLGPREMAEPEQ